MPRVKDTVTQLEPELRNIARKSSISSYIALLRARPPSHPAEASLRDARPPRPRLSYAVAPSTARGEQVGRRNPKAAAVAHRWPPRIAAPYPEGYRRGRVRAPRPFRHIKVRVPPCLVASLVAPRAPGLRSVLRRVAWNSNLKVGDGPLGGLSMQKRVKMASISLQNQKHVSIT